MNQRAKIGILVMAVLGGAIFSLRGLASKVELPTRASLEVIPRLLVKETIYRGEVSLLNEKSIVSPVTGKLQWVSVRLGQKVKRGEILAKFDSDSVSDQINQLRAVEKATEIWMRESYPILLQTRLLELDKKKEETHKTTVEHQAKVFAIGEGIKLGISSDLDLQAALNAQSIANRDAQIQTSSKEQQIAEMRQQHAEADAKLSSIRTDIRTRQEELSSLQIRAPFDGTVVGISTKMSSRDAENHMKAKDYLLTLTNMDSIGVTVKVAPQELNQLAATSRASCQNMATHRASGCKLISVESTAIDDKNFIATFAPSGDKAEWGLGEKVNVTVRLKEKNAQKAVPIRALTTQNDVTGVMVERSGSLQFRPVKTGFSAGDFIEIVEGLSPGERVAVP